MHVATEEVTLATSSPSGSETCRERVRRNRPKGRKMAENYDEDNSGTVEMEKIKTKIERFAGVGRHLEKRIRI